jgi:multiple sugar transport system substrate-binding protein
MNIMIHKLLRPGLLLFVALVLILSTAPVTAQNAINIRIFVGVGTGDRPDQQPQEDALAKLWNDTHKDIQIKFDYYQNAVARDQLITQVTGGNPPDIVGPIGIRGVFSTPDLWENLSKYIDKDKVALKLDDYDPGVLKTFEAAGGVNLSVALGIYPSMLWVNEDAFKAADVPLPPKEFGAKYTDRDGKEHVWDYTTLAMVAKQVTQDASGKFGDEEGFDPKTITTYGYSDSMMNFRQVMMRFGAKTAGVAEDGKSAPFLSDPAYLTAVKWYQQGVWKDHFIPDQAATNSISQNGTPFETGKIGMFYVHSWYTCCMSKATFKWGIYASPAVPGTEGKTIVAPIHADTYVIVSKSPNKDAAWEVMKWLNSPEIQPQLCAIFGCIPARKSARAPWEETTLKNFPGFDTKVVYAAAPYADLPSHEAGIPNYPAAFDAMEAFWLNVRTNPDIDVDKALADMNKLVQSIFDGNIPATPTK